MCGLSCRLCPTYQADTQSRCAGCKSESRMKVGCPLITCAVKKRGIEFCWQCPEDKNCERWRERRERGRSHDSFVCYQRLEDNIAFISHRGISAFVEDQIEREQLLKAMLAEFNEGRSKSFYSIVATIMDIQEIRQAVARARNESVGKDIKGRSKALHLIFDEIAEEKKYNLRLRK